MRKFNLTHIDDSTMDVSKGNYKGYEYYLVDKTELKDMSEIVISDFYIVIPEGAFKDYLDAGKKLTTGHEITYVGYLKYSKDKDEVFVMGGFVYGNGDEFASNLEELCTSSIDAYIEYLNKN